MDAHTDEKTFTVAQLKMAVKWAMDIREASWDDKWKEYGKSLSWSATEAVTLLDLPLDLSSLIAASLADWNAVDFWVKGPHTLP